MIFPPAYADESDSKIPFQVALPSADSLSNLKRGNELFAQGNYAAAMALFKNAYDELPIMRDFTLLMIAKIHNRTERFDKSEESLGELLDTYPDSLLTQRARALQIKSLMLTVETKPKEAGLVKQNSASLAHLEQYVADYPEDTEMVFFLAEVMKKLGNVQKARSLFTRIYTGVSPYSDPAFQQLQPSDVTLDDILLKASNLIKAFQYKEAETLVKKFLTRTDADESDELYRTLGLALFKQKKYREAAAAFQKGGNLYDSARSLYRAGEFTAFNEILAQLISMEDKRAGLLLLAYASAKRREGKKEESLKMYADLKKTFSQYTEDALWGIAWTHYRAGDYAEASETLTELNDRYPNPRYLYWKQQSNRGDLTFTPPSESPTKVSTSREDFYNLLSLMRDADRFNGRSVRQISYASTYDQPVTMRRQTAVELKRLSPEIRASLERFRIFVELDMRENAISELVRASNRVSKPDMLIYLCRALQNAGEYKRAISLVSRFTDREMREGDQMSIRDVLYPLAYWTTVREVSGHNMLDPLLLLSVMREESRFDPRARSVAGALGLMQIMPHTARNFNRRLKLDIPDDAAIYDVKTNITIGGYYLNSLLKEFGSLPVALAAYNAGHETVREWLKKGNFESFDEFLEDIPYDETKTYVKRVLLTYAAYMHLWEKQ
ncbi:MAG TPA: transglycosylase SLT domain-containing protein [Thermodesulfovibrionales bacterium]|nr:transglycosylase SLT domain-containing protein [Thermodesulfovibrionales bacterium]